MGSVASFVGDVVGGAVDVVGDVVEGVGDIGQDVIDVAADTVSSVGDTVSGVVEGALENPIGTAAMIATAVTAPALLPVVSAGNVIANGGNIEDALISAGAVYAGQAVASTLNSQLGTALDYGTDVGSSQTGMLAAQDAGLFAPNAVVAPIGNAAGVTTAGVIQGQDLGDALERGLISGAGRLVGQEVGLQTGSPTVGNIAGAVTAGTLSGQDPTQVFSNSLVNNLIDQGIGSIRDVFTQPSTGTTTANSGFSEEELAAIEAGAQDAENAQSYAPVASGSNVASDAYTNTPLVNEPIDWENVPNIVISGVGETPEDQITLPPETSILDKIGGILGLGTPDQTADYVSMFGSGATSNSPITINTGLVGTGTVPETTVDETTIADIINTPTTPTTPTEEIPTGGEQTADNTTGGSTIGGNITTGNQENQLSNQVVNAVMQGNSSVIEAINSGNYSLAETLANSATQTQQGIADIGNQITTSNQATTGAINDLGGTITSQNQALQNAISTGNENLINAVQSGNTDVINALNNGNVTLAETIASGNQATTGALSQLGSELTSQNQALQNAVATGNSNIVNAVQSGNQGVIDALTSGNTALAASLAASLAATTSGFGDLSRQFSGLTSAMTAGKRQPIEDLGATVVKGGAAELASINPFANLQQQTPTAQAQNKSDDLFFDEEDIYSAKEGGLIEHNPQFFSEGGLGSLENRYVKGDGDGTSDSIPAMLATGEFVIPADVVSGLGNGDNEAGAQVLDHFMMAIRKHKRAADPSELPEDSKGPLEYLKEAKRKVRI